MKFRHDVCGGFKMGTLKWVPLRRLECTCEETRESVWPPNGSLYASPFGRGFKLCLFTFDLSCLFNYTLFFHLLELFLIWWIKQTTPPVWRQGNWPISFHHQTQYQVSMSCEYHVFIIFWVPVHTKARVILKRCFRSENASNIFRPRDTCSNHRLFFHECLRKTRGVISYYCDLIVFEKLRFQSVFSPH